MSRTHGVYGIVNKARGNVFCAAPMVLTLCALILFTFFVSLPIAHYAENVPLREEARHKGIILSGKSGFEDNSYYLTRRGASVTPLLLTLAITVVSVFLSANAAVSIAAGPRKTESANSLFLQQNLPLRE